MKQDSNEFTVQAVTASVHAPCESATVGSRYLEHSNGNRNLFEKAARVQDCGEGSESAAGGNLAGTTRRKEVYGNGEKRGKRDFQVGGKREE